MLGMPVSHSLSPAMHNAAFAHLGINAQYQLFQKQPQDLDVFFAQLADLRIEGLNVTIPYKEKVLHYVTLDRTADSHLQEVGAINTIVRRGQALAGFNTDISGFTKDLQEKSIEVKARSIAMLGAGGAAKAVIYALARLNAGDITIFDIDAGKINDISVLIKRLFPGFKLRAAGSVEELNIPHKDLLINATPVGMKAGDACLVKKEYMHKGLVVYDLIYNPRETVLLRTAAGAGARAYNGLGMLLHQGADSFEYFTGRPAPVEIMKEALENAIARLTH